MTIEEFIEARLAEDEHDAKNASGTATERDWVYGLGRVSDTGEYGGLHAETHDPRDGVHIARHDPARVLRQCAAMRVALNWYIEDDEMVMAATINAIAAIWSDHPEFQESWGMNG